jgi:hypothetical protein
VTVERDLVTLLQNQGLTVYPGTIPENGTYPNVVYQRISTPQIRTHAGVALEYPRFQLSCWARSYGDSLATALTVKEALDLNQVTFKLATQEGELDLMDEEAELYRRVLDFFLWVDKE